MARYSIKTKLASVAVVLAGLLAAGYGWHRNDYPYGWSHCCILQFKLSLDAYAREHDGFFPAGKACPEASLSLLYYGDYGMDANILRGKTVPLAVAESALARDGCLRPDSCGWHYVEGLTLADDGRLAVIWDKVGLSYNGGRMPGGGHEVLFLSGMSEYIFQADWPQFLQRQEQLMTARTEAAKKGLPILTAKVRLPSGEIVDHYDAPFTLDMRGFGRSSTDSNTVLARRDLRWWELHDGTGVLTLSLATWKFEPVQVHVSDGKASPDSIVFELQTENNEPPQDSSKTDKSGR